MTALITQQIALSRYQGYVPVVVAVEEIAPETKLEKYHLTLRYVEKRFEGDHDNSSIEDLLGRTIKTVADKGSRIHEKHFVDLLDEDPIPIPPGFKVIAIKMGPTGDLFKAHDQIDLFIQTKWLWDLYDTQDTIRDLTVFSVGPARQSPNEILGVLVDDPTSKRIRQLQDNGYSMKIILHE